MNERIKELIGNAKFIAEGSINKKISANEELYAFANEFAELIVKECLDVLGKERRARLDKADLVEANIIQKSAVAIIKHFGIKE